MFNKMRISFLLVIMLILSSVFPISVNAVTDTTLKNTDIINDDALSGDYDNYISQYKDVKSSSIDIIIENVDVSFANNEIVDFSIVASNEALYALKFEYATTENGREPLAISLKIDGSYLYKDLEYINLPRYYQDIGNKRTDNKGNEIAKEIGQKIGNYEIVVRNENNTDYLLIYLNEGIHTLQLENLSDEFELLKIGLIEVPKTISYKEYKNKYNSFKKINAYEIYEAENTILKTSYNLTQLTDNTSVNVSPHNPTTDKVNYVGGKNWSQPNDTIFWEIDVKEDGLYSLGFNYRQNYTLNTSFYREIKIDGVVPFEEAKSIEFPYALNWQFHTISDEKGNPYFFYFSKGKHIISLSVTLGDLSNICDELEDITYNIASLYRSIIMITGDTPDANRDYNLFDRIGDFSEQLDTYVNQLNNINKNLSIVFGNDSVSAISTVNGMINVMRLMKDHKYTAHKYINRYYDCYASLTSMLMELKSMPLDIDSIYIGNDFKNTKSGIFETVSFSFRRFLASFVSDYSNDIKSESERPRITLWVNWGRDQAKVLKYLIQSDFSYKNNIDVDIKITNATLTHAALSGNGPDCQLHLSRSEPVNLAMRDAVYDLTKFEDYEEVASRFNPSASNCYKFENGIFALPDTQTFFMMFIRTDIFKDMGLEIPKTWEEFIETSVLLFRQNMQVGLPYTQIAEMTQVNLGVGALSIYPTLLIQNDGKLYNDNFSEIELLSETSIDTFTQWTDFYTKYGFPKTYDFFNRFRLGLMPMAVQNYTMYATLSAAAPEISEFWEMYELPGTVDSNGGINNYTTGGGTGAVILSASKQKKAAWEFIKWWTSADIQYRYGTEVENILGSSARNATANVEALKMYSWKKSTLNNILTQWDKVEELPEVPGGYYVSRVLDQAFWNVTNASENPKDMLMKWNTIAQTEITRKREQYDIE